MLSKLVLEDLPAVIEDVQGAQDLTTAGIDTVSYDFFNQVQFKNVLHDWSDEKAAIIFNNLKPAMKPGFSKIIAEEYILPDQNARSLPCMTDIAVMVFCSGLERMQQRWTDLMTSVGLRVVKFWAREGDGLGIVESELPEDS